MKAHQKMLLGISVGAVAGIIANAAFGDAPWLQGLVEHVTNPVGQLFIRLLLMLVVPLLFSALVVGVAELDLKQVGRLGARTLGYTVVFSIISVFIGLLLVNTLQPGAGLVFDKL